MATRAAIKPITYMKTHAAELLSLVSEKRRPVIITHNGEGKMVIQDIESYERMMRTITLLKIAALGQMSVERGEVRPAREAFTAVERRTKARRGLPDV